MNRTFALLLLLLSLACVAFGTQTFNIDSSDICNTITCNNDANSYTGAYNGTGESDYRGVINVGTDFPNDSFDQAGFICTTSNSSCPSLPYASGLTITRDTEEFQSLNLYRFLDTFTNNTSATISGDINVYTNLAWVSEGETAEFPYSTDESQLVVITDSGDDRPAYTLVTGNNAWANNNVTYYEDGRSPTDNFYVTVLPGQSISLLEFMGLSATEPTMGNYVPDSATALAMGNNLLTDPYIAGLTPTQLDSIVNFTFNPESGTWILVLCGLALFLFKLYKVRRKARTA